MMMTLPDDPHAASSAALAILERTRSAVTNVLLAVGLGIAVSGWALARREPGLPPWPPTQARRVAYAALCALIAASVTIRRVWASRCGLRKSARRAARLYASHVVSAGVGALSVPLGFAYAWSVRPTLDGVGPFWLAGLALVALAQPRDNEIEAFDAPMMPPREPDR